MLIIEQVIFTHGWLRGSSQTTYTGKFRLYTAKIPSKAFLSLIWAIHDVRFTLEVIRAKGLSSGPLQLSLVDSKNIVLQRHDL